MSNKVQSLDFSPEGAAASLGYALGKTYADHYWGENHTIVRAFRNEAGFAYVTSRWSDGHETTHCTQRDKRDVEVQS